MLFWMNNNKLFIAAAGAGKTTFLVNEALVREDKRILITTYTRANNAEIKKKIFNEAGCNPKNIDVQTWFSFLIKHGVKPYQGFLFQKEISGMVLVNSQSGIKYYKENRIPVYFKETEIKKHYFTNEQKIYSDKISKFVIKCNEASNGAVIGRLSKIYSSIFIDEVQDLASYDLELLKLLFESKMKIIMVGDPRQVVYVTHHAKKLKKYSDGKIADFITNECRKISVIIDETTLKNSHRNNSPICALASKIYPDMPPCEPCNCADCRVTSVHEGIFLVREKDVNSYLETYNPTQLRLNINTKGVNQDYDVTNFGLSKGQSFDRVLIFPTADMKKWLINNNHKLASKTRAQFYVGVTRARKSVGIVFNFDENNDFEGIEKFIPD